MSKSGVWHNIIYIAFFGFWFFRELSFRVAEVMKNLLVFYVFLDSSLCSEWRCDGKWILRCAQNDSVMGNGFFAALRMTVWWEMDSSLCSEWQEWWEVDSSLRSEWQRDGKWILRYCSEWQRDGKWILRYCSEWWRDEGGFFALLRMTSTEYGEVFTILERSFIKKSS